MRLKLFLISFLLLFFFNLQAQDDCDCPDIIDPVCVIDDTGDIISFDNACLANCAGYTDDLLQPCDIIDECTAEIFAESIDEENFIWLFSYTSTGNVVEQQWDFGDGTTSSEVSPEHTYTFPGIYFVSLTTICADGSTATDLHILYAGNCYNIIIAIQSNPSTYAFGSIANSQVLSYFWDFDDGQTSTSAVPVHTFPGAGTYNVSLTTVHADECEWTSFQTIIIEEPCICPDIYDPVCVINPDGELIEFDNACFAECEGYTPEEFVDCALGECFVEISATQIDDEAFVWQFEGITSNDVISYHWSFGDGTTSDLENPVHTYQEPGLYIVHLTITTAFCEYTAFYFLIAGNCDNVIIASPINNYTIAFGYISSGVVELHWDFGDGNTSTENTPVHTYEEDGFYTVSLTTYHENGCSWTSTIELEIGCICPDNYDPVCVVNPDGEIIEYTNFCEAECDGYNLEDLVECGDDCICPDIWDPVCVVTDFGEEYLFGNACEAECAGFEEGEYVPCGDEDSPFDNGQGGKDDFSITENELPGVSGEITSNSLHVMDLNLYPNPVTSSELMIEFYTEKSINTQLYILAVDGSVLSNKALEQAKGKQKIVINVDQYERGIYFVKIITDQTEQVMKFIKL